jgi:hypothetical protein
MGSHRRLWKLAAAKTDLVLLTALLGSSAPADAADGKWSFKIEPMYVDAYGHDQQVLTIHEIDLAAPRQENKTALSLDTDADLAYRAEIQYRKDRWGLGADYFLFLTAQSGEDRAASPSSPIDEVAFEVAGRRRFTSSSPNDVLFYSVLEDTDLEVWTADLYGIRTLSETSGGSLDLQVGVRVGDFDNDYHAVVGVEGVGGLLLDSSSNYGLMFGPLVALSGNIRHGRSHIEGYIGQSVLLGNAELSSMSREFTGTFTEETTPTIVSAEAFRKSPDPDVAIPITEFRVKFTYELTRRISLGVGAHTSTWWDVPVPPGITPAEGGDQALHEDTVIFFGLLGGLKVTF